MADSAVSLWHNDFIPLHDFVFDWAEENSADFQSIDSLDKEDSVELMSRPKRIKREHDPNHDSSFTRKPPSIVPASTRKLLAILHRLKNDEMKLYAFVSYDKYDSLVYFPTSLARCYTSANVQAYSRLLTRFYHPRCCVTFSEHVMVQRRDKSPIRLTITRETGVTQRECLRIFALSRDSHPDCVCNILSTHVIDNQIHAEMMYSYTDIPDMYASTASTTNHPFMRVPQAGNRSTLLAKHLQLSAYPLSVQQQLMALFDSSDMLVFHVKLKMIFTVNLHTNKILDIQCIGVQTSVEHKNVIYSLA